MHVLLTGKPPFTGRNDKEITKNIKYQPLRFANKIYSHISFEGTDLLRKMLTKNPVNRPSANHVLSHSWFKSFKSEVNVEDVNEALCSLKNFQASDTLKSAIRTFIATQLVSH